MNRKFVTGLSIALAASLSATPAMAADVDLSVFNSKSEIQTQMEDEAKTYSEEKGVNMTVTMSNDPIVTHMSSKYASKDPYALAMVDVQDVYQLTPDHGIDLSDLEAAADTDYAIKIDGKVAALPFCIEARGLIYNKTAIEKITGKDFNPDDYKTLDAFQGLLDELVKGGMESPVGLMNEDWSLGGHFLSQVYEEQADTDAFIAELQAGQVDLMKDSKFTSLMDTFDTLKKYDYAQGNAAITADRNTTEDMLAFGDIAFMFGGSWDWSILKQSESDDELGMMPIPQNTDDGTNEKLVGGSSKFWFIDNSVSEEEQQAAKDFLNWMALDEEGQKFVAETCELVSPYKSNTLEAADPLSVSVKEYTDAGKLIPGYNFLPGDHYSACGAFMQKYLAGEIEREELAKDIEDYWKTAKTAQSGETEAEAATEAE